MASRPFIYAASRRRPSSLSPVKQERGEVQSRGGDGNSKAEVLTRADLKQGELGELHPTG